MRLSTLLLVFLFIASGVAAFGLWVLPPAGYVLALLLGIWAVRAGHWWAWFLLAFVVCVVLLVLFPPIPTPRCILTRWRCCDNNLKKLALALHCYHDHYGCFPPAVVRSAEGKPVHSWRVLILPYLDCAALYEQYDFSEPWNGPNNRQLVSEMPCCYCCPSAQRKNPEQHVTNYVAVTGPGTFWPPQGAARRQDTKDGMCNTLLLVELNNSDICWMEPRDLSLPNRENPESWPGQIPRGHLRKSGYFVVEKQEGGNVALASGAVFFTRPLSAEGVAALARHSDGRPAGVEKSSTDLPGLPDSYFDTRVERWVSWPHVVGLPLFLLTFLVLLWKAAFARIEKKLPADRPAG